MVSISAFGTRRAAPISGLALLPLLLTAAAPPPPPPAPTVEFSVSGLRSSQWQLLVCLTSTSTDFPDSSPDAAEVRTSERAADAGNVHVPAHTTGPSATSCI